MVSSKKKHLKKRFTVSSKATVLAGKSRKLRLVNKKYINIGTYEGEVTLYLKKRRHSTTSVGMRSKIIDKFEKTNLSRRLASLLFG